MRPFAELADRTARWLSPMRWKRRFELSIGDEQFASMEFERACGAVIVARTREHAWTLVSEGAGGTVLEVRDAVRSTCVATFRGDWRGGGLLERPNGSALSWSGANTWMTRWAFRSANGSPWVEFRVDAMRLVPTALVRFEPGMAADPDAPLVAVVGWQLALQAFETVHSGERVALVR